MEIALTGLIGLFFSVGIFLLLSRAIIRMLLGLALLANGVNLLILVSGRLTRITPPIVPPGLEVAEGAVANPLPQALILTAIVIGFALFAFLLVLGYRAYQSLEADNTDYIRVAEPKGGPQPPLGY